MQILLVDDEELARQRLKRMLQALEGCEVVGEAETGEEALDKIHQLDPELVVLDVRMPGMDGISLAKQLGELDDPPAVVFCTAYDEYALEAFDTLAQGYIVKPVEQEQLEVVIEKAKKVTKLQRQGLNLSSGSSTRRHLAAKSRKGMELIPFEEVLCFYADQKYVTVVHAGGETLIDDTLKDLEQEFSDQLLRIHRNALVCLDKVDGLEKNAEGQFQLRLKQSDYHPVVSRRHLAFVKEALAHL